MKVKKAKVKFIIMLTMMILSLGITFKVMALQSPNLMLSGSENVITDNNAILHATLYNAQAEGINVKAFKWTIYKGKISNNIVVKSIEKVNTAAGNKIGCYDQGLFTAVTAVNHIEYLFQCKVRVPFYSEVINDQKAVAV